MVKALSKEESDACWGVVSHRKCETSAGDNGQWNCLGGVADYERPSTSRAGASAGSRVQGAAANSSLAQSVAHHIRGAGGVWLHAILGPVYFPKIFPKFFRFPITSIFGHMHEALNIDKK
jgi:hypothetical protein